MRRRDRGASLVEFALLLPLLALLLFGTLTGGLTFSRQNSVKNAVREATRYGAVVPDFTDAAAIADNLDALYQQVKTAATGDLDPGIADRIVCVAAIDSDDRWYYGIYTSSDTGTVNTTGISQPSLPGAVGTACDVASVGTVGSGTNRIWVRATRSSDIDAVIYSQTLTLEAKSLARSQR